MKAAPIASSDLTSQRTGVMVRHWSGPIVSLADAFRAQRHLWVLCLGCGHARKVDPRDLIMKLGYVSFDEARGKLRCRRCRSRRARLVPHDQPWPAMR
ncbi:MAG TPA: hypothetical protein VF502_17740 [Stellaceae bacterium]